MAGCRREGLCVFGNCVKSANVCFRILVCPTLAVDIAVHRSYLCPDLPLHPRMTNHTSYHEHPRSLV